MNDPPDIAHKMKIVKIPLKKKKKSHIHLLLWVSWVCSSMLFLDAFLSLFLNTYIER